MRRLLAIGLPELRFRSPRNSRQSSALPEPPPPPPGLALDPALEPQVTITTRGEDQVEEFRVNGKLYAVKVTPPHGVPTS